MLKVRASRLLNFAIVLQLLLLQVNFSVQHAKKNSALLSSVNEDALARTEAQNRAHVQQALDTLMYPEKLNIDHREASQLHRVGQDEPEKLAYSSSGDDYSIDNTADIQLMNETFARHFSRPRSDGYSKRLKDSARQAILARFREYRLDTFKQSFSATKRGKVNKGTNLIGVLPGRNRDTPGKDTIVLLGAHYDTVETSPGIDDNGSGMVATLEVARILSSKPQFNHTVMFVAFDLEELGLLGSSAFVREYLIPTELISRKAKFVGAYVIDMVLNYDSSPNSQILPRDIQSGTPDITRKISQEGNRGDFVAVWMRKGVDNDIYSTLANEWRKSADGSHYKIRAFEPQLPSTPPTNTELHRFGTFTRSDHASFWYHKHPNYRQTLNAVLLTDMEFERPKKLLVFVNPIGGKRKAGKIYDTKVAPILHLAGIQVEHIVTQRANHARDLLADTSHPIKDYDGFVCVGGDGMFAELLNGILERTQKENNIECNQVDARLARPSIPIGVIPAGSTDAVAFSVTGTNDPVSSTVHIIFGKRIDIDVSSIHNARENDRLIRYATSFLAYGFFGDILLDSESNRWMGPKRYDLAGLKKFLGHKLYEGEIKLYISTADGSPKDTNICQAECPLCAKSGLRDRYAMSDMKRTNETNANNEELENVPPAEQTCITIRGRFLAINSATMTCRCDKAKKGISPSAHLGNGCSDLIIVSQCSRINYLRYLARTGWLSASPFELPFVDVYRVREFEFTPIVSSNDMKNSNGQSSVWNCDGEVITDPAVRVKVHCQLLPVFGTGRENRITNKATLCYAGYRKVRDVNENSKELDYSNGSDSAHPPIIRT